MKQEIIYALDFDGVICDSAVETSITGWKAGSALWDDMQTALPAQSLIDRFRKLRPVLETGYEAILIMRLLHDGETVESLFSGYENKIRQVQETLDKDIAELKKLFGQTRDEWIAKAQDEWIAMNPLFPNIAEKLQGLDESQWYIITTKQERFVSQILQGSDIQLADERIFGLDRNMSKQAVLTELLEKHPQQTFHFVEDRLPTLSGIIANDALKPIKLLFAKWGYNTREDKRKAAAEPSIELIDIDGFLQ